MIIENSGKVSLSRMTLEDLAILSPVLLSEFDDYWSPSILKEELTSPNSKYYVAKINDLIAGFAGIKIVLKEADIMNIVTKKEVRNRRYCFFVITKINTNL